MASSKVYYDSRNRKGEGLLSIIIRHKGGMFTVPLNIQADQWDKQKQEVNRKHPQNRLYNNHIRSILAALTEEGQLDGLTTQQLKRIVLSKLQTKTEATAISVQDFAASIIANIATKRTREIHQQTILKLNDYTGSREIYFADITLDWLKNFDAWMNRNGMSTNGKSVHLRNIRAQFNKAIDKEIIPQGMYPFRRFKIKKESPPQTIADRRRAPHAPRLSVRRVAGEMARYVYADLLPDRDQYTTSYSWFSCVDSPAYRAPRGSVLVTVIRSKACCTCSASSRRRSSSSSSLLWSFFVAVLSHCRATCSSSFTSQACSARVASERFISSLVGACRTHS